MLFSIMLTRGTITVDDVMIAIDHEIEIHFADRRGNVQAMYDNQDSIFIVPMSLELVKSMKIIGKNLDLDLILKTRSTLCF